MRGWVDSRCRPRKWRNLFPDKEKEIQKRKLDGLEKTITGLKLSMSKKNKEISKLTKELGILQAGEIIEDPSFPPIILGEGLYARPVCAEHGEMLRYKNNIYRCPTCLTSVDLTNQYKWTSRIIREEIKKVEITGTGVYISINSLLDGEEYLFGNLKIKVKDGHLDIGYVR